MTYVVVSSGDSHEDTSFLGTGDSIVASLAERAAQAKVEGGFSESVLGSGVGNTPVNTLDHARGRTGASSGKDLDGDNVGLLSNSVCSASEGTSGVGSVAVAISVVVIDGVGSPADTASEFRVVDINTGVNTINGDALASRAVIDKVLVSRSLVGDSAQTPGGSVWLGGESGQLDNAVVLYIVDLDLPVRINQKKGRKKGTKDSRGLQD